MALGGGLFIVRNGAHEERTLLVRRGEIVRQISVSGQVVPADNIDLSFEQGGRINRIGVKVGDTVSRGSFIASEDTAELDAELAEIEARIGVRRAKLNQLLAGAQPEDVAVAETALANAAVEVESATTALLGAKQGLLDTLSDAYTRADDAVHSKTDQLFANPRSASPQLFLRTSVDSRLKADIEWARFGLESDVFQSWRDALSALTLERNGAPFVLKANTNLALVRSYLEKLSLAVTGLTPYSDLSQATIDGWKTDIGAARTSVNTAIINITASETTLKAKEALLASAEGSHNAAESALALAKAPARPSDIALSEAEIAEAEASAQSILVQIGKRRLYAPLRGLISAVPLKVGSTVAANEAVASLISAEKLQIESYIPEIHVPLIHLGDEAAVTLDAYGDHTPFRARVIAVDPAETSRDGISTYKTTLEFIERDERIKSGMTANIVILSERKGDVLSVPQGAVKRKDGGTFLKIRAGDVFIERRVETGIISSSGEIEIVSGLSEGDIVLLEPAAAER